MFFVHAAFKPASGGIDRAVSQIAPGRGRARRFLAAGAGALLLAGSLFAQEPDSARDLARTGERLAESGDARGALEALGAARRAIVRQVEDGRGVDPGLADYLGRSLYNLGVRLNNAGDPDGSIAAFTEALELIRVAPKSLDATIRGRLRSATLDVGAYLTASGRPEASVKACALLLDRSPHDASALVGLGSARLVAGDVRGAESAFRAALESDPARVEAAAGLGSALMRDPPADARDPADPDRTARRREEAVAWMARARDAEPGSAERERKLGAAFEAAGESLGRAGEGGPAEEALAAAGAAFRRGAALDDASPWGVLDLATHLFKVRRYADAAGAFDRAAARLEGLLAERPADLNAGAWRKALDVCRDNRAAAAYNRAVDALNEARFAELEGLLAPACDAGAGWRETCARFLEAARARRAAFEGAVEEREASLRSHPDRAADLLALGDLWAHVGRYEQAASYYERLARTGADVSGLADRVAGVRDAGNPKRRSLSVEVPGGEVETVYFREGLDRDLEPAIRAAWLRVTTSLGQDALAGSVAVAIHPNKRAFRERATERVGGMVRGYYLRGVIHLYDEPSRRTVDWVTMLTHELAHHAVARLSGDALPRWYAEGIARYVEGDTALVDMTRLGARLQAGLVPALGGLDDLTRRSWNDPEAIRDVRDAALLAVAEIARRSGTAGLKRILAQGGAFEASVVAVSGTGLDEIDRGWRERVSAASP